MKGIFTLTAVLALSFLAGCASSTANVSVTTPKVENTAAVQCGYLPSSLTEIFPNFNSTLCAIEFKRDTVYMMSASEALNVSFAVNATGSFGYKPLIKASDFLNSYEKNIMFLDIEFSTHEEAGTVAVHLGSASDNVLDLSDESLNALLGYDLIGFYDEYKENFVRTYDVGSEQNGANAKVLEAEAAAYEKLLTDSGVFTKEECGYRYEYGEWLKERTSPQEHEFEYECFNDFNESAAVAIKWHVTNKGFMSWSID